MMNRVFPYLLSTIVLSMLPAIALAEDPPPDPNDQVQSRGIKVFGCEITPDVNAVKRCLDNKIDDMVKDATRSLNRQVTDLRGAIDDIGRTPITGCRVTPNIRQAADCINDKVERQVNLEVAKAQAQLNAQLKALDR